MKTEYQITEHLVYFPAKHTELGTLPPAYAICKTVGEYKAALAAGGQPSNDWDAAEAELRSELGHYYGNS